MQDTVQQYNTHSDTTAMICIMRWPSYKNYTNFNDTIIWTSAQDQQVTSYGRLLHMKYINISKNLFWTYSKKITQSQQKHKHNFLTLHA